MAARPPAPGQQTPSAGRSELSQELSGLGGGGSGDQLHARLVLRVLARCLPLLAALRRHLIALGLGFSLLLVMGLPLGFILPDIFWTRVLGGEPPTPLEARLLGFERDAFADPARFDAAARGEVRDRWLILLGVLAAVAIPVVTGLLYYAFWILQRINQVLRVQLVDRLQTLSLRYHADSPVGDAIYRVYQDSAQVTAVIETLFLRPVQFALTFLVGFVFVALLSPLLALAVAALCVPAALLARRFSGELRVRFRRAREAQSRLTSRIQETLVGIRVIKAYGAEGFEQARFEAASREAFSAAFSARTELALFGVLAFLLAGSVLLGLQARVAWLARVQAPLFAAGFLGLTTFNLGMFNAARSRLGSATNAIEALLRFWGRAQDIAIGLDRAFHVLDLEPEVQDAPDAIAVPPLAKGIAFRDVSFAYTPGNAVLEGVRLFAPAGSMTAIVGPTGSGKSTLVALLMRLFDVDRGAIEIDGIDLRRFRMQSLRAQIAIALQETVLFNASVRENLRYAAPRASDAESEAAARTACADEFIRELPGGYDTLLGERGVKLSSGQRQRIAIARALLKDAPILILDEPTAALDARTERRVLANLAVWGRNRAIFVITHRLSTIRGADQIVVLEAGQIVETGEHAELARRPGGRYRRMIELEERGLHPRHAPEALAAEP